MTSDQRSETGSGAGPINYGQRGRRRTTEAAQRSCLVSCNWSYREPQGPHSPTALRPHCRLSYLPYSHLNQNCMKRTRQQQHADGNQVLESRWHAREYGPACVVVMSMVFGNDCIRTQWVLDPRKMPSLANPKSSTMQIARVP